MCHPDAAYQTQPLAEGLRLVEGQHGLPHLTAMADRNIRHELHSSGNHRVTLACSNQTDSWRDKQKGETKQRKTQ